MNPSSWTTPLVTLGLRDTRSQWIIQPAETPADTAPILARIQQISSQAPLLAYRDVTISITNTVHAAENLAATVAHIRDFVEAARADVDIRTPFARRTPASN